LIFWLLFYQEKSDIGTKGHWTGQALSKEKTFGDQGYPVFPNAGFRAKSTIGINPSRFLVKTQIHPFTLRHQKPKIACSFFSGLRCTRNIVEKRIVEAPYPGLLIFHPLRGG
jgi:hypothetical protein